MNEKTNGAARPRRNPMRELQRVHEWNTRHPEGTRVSVKLDDGSVVKTETLTEAWLSPAQIDLIKVCGIAGAYRLDRVTAL